MKATVSHGILVMPKIYFNNAKIIKECISYLKIHENNKPRIVLDMLVMQNPYFNNAKQIRVENIVIPHSKVILFNFVLLLCQKKLIYDMLKWSPDLVYSSK